MDKLLIVAPVFNEEELIEEFLDRVVNLIDEAELVGLIIVDDGSTDRTGSLIEAKGIGYPVRLRLITLSRNFGHQNAVLAGLCVACSWAPELEADWIGIIDADLQDQPEDFVSLMTVAPDWDVVYAVRRNRNDGLLMRLAAPLFYRILAWSAAYRVPTDAGTFSVIRLPVARIICESAHSNPYFPGLRAWAGFRQTGVPLNREARARGKSKVGMMGLWALSLRALLLYSRLLLNICLVSGMTVFLLACVMSAVLIFMRLFGLISIPGATTIVVLQLFSLGVQLLFIGLIAHMIDRVNSNTSNQSAWLIMEDRRLS